MEVRPCGLGAGRHGAAARLSLATGDSTEGLRLGYRAISAGDTASVRAGLEVVTTVAGPQSGEQMIDVAKAYEKLGALGTALEFAERAAADDSAAPSTHEYLGDLLNRRRQRWAATAP